MRYSEYSDWITNSLRRERERQEEQEAKKRRLEEEQRKKELAYQTVAIDYDKRFMAIDEQFDLMKDRVNKKISKETEQIYYDINVLREKVNDLYCTIGEQEKARKVTQKRRKVTVKSGGEVVEITRI